MKLAFAVLALAAAPGLALAMGCSKQHQAMSCADGMIWDEVTRSCVQQVSS